MKLWAALSPEGGTVLFANRNSQCESGLALSRGEGGKQLVSGIKLAMPATNILRGSTVVCCAALW